MIVNIVLIILSLLGAPVKTNQTSSAPLALSSTLKIALENNCTQTLEEHLDPKLAPEDPSGEHWHSLSLLGLDLNSSTTLLERSCEFHELTPEFVPVSGRNNSNTVSESSRSPTICNFY